MRGMTFHLQAQRIGAICAIPLLACTLLLAACSSGGTTSGSTTNGSTNTPTVAATAKPKPSAVPQITLAFCQGAASIAQVNQILNPVNPANTIVPDNGGTGGSCNYEYAATRIDVFVLFEPYTGGSLSTLATEAATADLKGGTITSNQPVSGLGDQSLFLSGTGSDSSNGVSITGKGYELYVVYGGVAFGVGNITYNGTINSLGSVSDATILSEFEQIAQLFLAAL